jgi:hypothetical protein
MVMHAMLKGVYRYGGVFSSLDILEPRRRAAQGRHRRPTGIVIVGCNQLLSGGTAGRRPQSAQR